MSEVIVKKKNEIVISEEDVNALEYISNGYSVSDTSEKMKINKRTLEARINRLRIHFACVNLMQLVSEFFRKGLIK